MKKILSVALSTAMAFSMFASVAFADEAKLDTQGKYDFLKEKGVFNGNPDGSAALDKEMTRAEFAKVITKLYGLEETTGVLTYKDKNYKEGVWFVPFIEAVTKAGLMEGKGKDLFDPNGKVTVEELAKVLTIALKLEIPTDADNSASPWAKGYVAAAVKSGLIPADANFKGNALRGLLVDASYIAYQAIEAAKIQVKGYKIVDSKTVEVTFSDDKVETVKLEKALEAGKETEVTVKHLDKEYTVKVTLTALEVTSVTAENRKEIVVNFNQEVDAASATNKANYKKDNGLLTTADLIVLSEDKKSVTITLSDNDLLQNQKSYKVTVQNVKSAGGAVIATTEKTLSVLDVTIPKVSKIEAVGTKLIRVTYSEPVQKDGALSRINYKVNGVVFSGQVKFADATNRVVNLVPYSALTAGTTYKVSVSDVKDYQGFGIVNVTDQEVVVADDKEAPTVAEIKEATLDYVTIVFSESVDPDTVAAGNVYWSDDNGTTKIKADSIVPVNDTTYKAVFATGSKLPNRTTTLYVEGVKDYSGNQIVKAGKEVTPTVDGTRPDLQSIDLVKTVDGKVDLTKLDQLEVTFSKAIISGLLDDAGVVTIKDSDGRIFTTVANVGSKANAPTTYVLTLGKKLVQGGTYTITVKDVKDTTALSNVMIETTKTIKVGDLDAPTVAGANKQARGLNDGGKLIVSFSEAVDLSTALDNKNYYIKLTTSPVFRQLPPGTVLQPTEDNKSVVINFPDKDADGTTAFDASNIEKVQVQLIKDVAGNELVATVENVNNLNLALEKVEQTDNSTLVATFSLPVNTMSGNVFTVSNNGTPVAVAVDKIETKDGKGVVTLKAQNDAKFSANALNVVLDIAPGQQVSTIIGSFTKAQIPTFNGTALDKTKASIFADKGTTYIDADGKVKVSTDGATAGNNTIYFSLTESVKFIAGIANTAVLTNDVTVTHGLNNDKLVPAQDFKVELGTVAGGVFTPAMANGNGNVIKVTFINPTAILDNVKVKLADEPIYLKDLNDNAVAGSTLETAASARIYAQSDLFVKNGLGATQVVSAGVAGVPQVTTIKVFNGVTTAATAKVTIGGVATDVVLTAADDTTAEVATKIAAAFTGSAEWTVAAVGDTVTFTKTGTITNNVAIAYDATTTGTVAVVTPQTTGVAPQKVLTKTAVTKQANATQIVVNVTDGTIDEDITVAVLAGDTTAQIAAKIVAALNLNATFGTDYVASVDGSNVVITHKDGQEAAVATVALTLVSVTSA